MAITATSLTGSFSGLDQSSYTTVSISPTSGRLVVAFIANRRADAGVPNTPTLSGAGITWEYEDGDVVSIGGLQTRLSMFKGIATASSGALTIDLAGQTQADANWSVFELANARPTLADAVRQSVAAVDSTGLSSTPNVTLAAFGNALNAGVAAAICRGTATTTNIAPGTDWTEIHDVAQTNLRLETQFRDNPDTSVDAGIFNGAVPTAAAWVMVGAEVAAGAVAGNNRRLMLGVG